MGTSLKRTWRKFQLYRRQKWFAFMDLITFKLIVICDQTKSALLNYRYRSKMAIGDSYVYESRELRETRRSELDDLRR